MSKFFKAFLEFKNEAEGTKQFALVAIAVITISLAMLSICGAWAKSEGEWLAFIPRFFYAFLVFGLEMLAAVLFVRALVAAHWTQAATCCAMLLFLAWANVQNAKDGVHFIMPTRFAETGQTLNEKAALAGEEAATLATAQAAALAGSGDELERVRTEIAALKAEQEELSSQSPEGIKKSQSRLIGQGHYFGKVDGIRDTLTEAAMRRRGEEITAQLKVLNQREAGFMAGQASPVQQATTDKRLQEIETRAAAREAESSAWRLEIILWVAEIARSLGLWAAIASIRVGSNKRDLERREELDELEHQNRLAELRAKRAKEPPTEAEKPAEPAPAPISESPVSESPPAATPQPEPETPIQTPPVTQEEAIPEPTPVVANDPQPEPEPEPIPEPAAYVEPELTAAERRAKKGGDANAFYKRAEKLKIPLPEQFPEDIEEQAA